MNIGAPGALTAMPQLIGHPASGVGRAESRAAEAAESPAEEAGETAAQEQAEQTVSGRKADGGIDMYA